MNRFFLRLAHFVVFVAACGGNTEQTEQSAPSSAGPPNDASSGSIDAAGTLGTDSGASQGAGDDGASSSVNPPYGGCGCACGAPVVLDVVGDEPDGGDGVLTDLTVTVAGVDDAGDPGYPLNCYRTGANPCQYQCSYGNGVSSGNDVTFVVSSPGYESATVELMFTHACSCCGCCASLVSGSPKSVRLEPTGTPITGCCANLSTDIENCGTCGHVCPSTSLGCYMGSCE